jgi:hypothetical protein
VVVVVVLGAVDEDMAELSCGEDVDWRMKRIAREIR